MCKHKPQHFLSSIRRFNSSEQHFAPLQMTFPKMLFHTKNPKILSCCLLSQPLTLILRCQTQSVSSFVCVRAHGFPLESHDSAKCLQRVRDNPKLFFLGSDSDVRQVALARSRQAESQTQG